MLFLLLFAAAAANDTPSVDDILRKVVERAAWDDAHKAEKNYVWTRHMINEEFDSNGAVKSRVDMRQQIVPLGQGKRSFRLLERDGKPVSEAERKAQFEKEQKALAGEGQNKKAAKKRNGSDDDVPINAALLAKYNWKFLGEEAIAGRPAYQLAFEPKSKDLPVNRMPDRVLNKLAGKVWIDATDFEISRADAHLTENASLWGGLAGTLRRVDIFFEQARMDEGPWLPRVFNIQIDGRIVVKPMRFHQMEEMSDFRKITPELIAESLQPLRR